MTFEEFFKKKKIDLVQLQTAEPGLFAEFKAHYEQMGEKSFDHTKKYWFNQLRRKFVPPVELKAEKLQTENPIAQQTITESLTEPAKPSTAFKPRFKAAVSPPPVAAETQKPLDEANSETIQESPQSPSEQTAVDAVDTTTSNLTRSELDYINSAEKEKPSAESSPKPPSGFKPRFKSSMVSKPAEGAKPIQPTAAQPSTTGEEEKPAEELAKPAVGFKPRFKASMANKPKENVQASESAPEQKSGTEESSNQTTPSAGNESPTDSSKPVGFKPRFNAAKMKPKDPEA